jgi:hypothetical protein
MSSRAGWQHSNADIFWGDIAFYDHVIQAYDTEEIFLEALAGFVNTGIQVGDCCVVIVTPEHLEQLNVHLRSYGASIDTLMAADRYIPVNAEELLSKIMVGSSVDEALFDNAMAPIFERCRNTKAWIRAGGEMVGLLIAQGNWSAALHLERLWNKLHQLDKFSIFCGYAKSIFDKASRPQADLIFAEHSKMISGSHRQSVQIYYKDKPLSLY